MIRTHLACVGVKTGSFTDVANLLQLHSVVPGPNNRSPHVGQLMINPEQVLVVPAVTAQSCSEEAAC